MQQNGVYDLLRMLEISLDEGFSIFGNYTIVKTNEVETLIDRIYNNLPVEVQEAKAFLVRKEELQMEAQQKAERIISEAQKEAERKLSEADYLKGLERRGNEIKAQVQDECNEIKRLAYEEAESVRSQARDEALKIREGAELYCEQVLTSLEGNLTQLQQVVKNGQVHMEKMRTDAINEYNSSQYKTPRQ